MKNSDGRHIFGIVYIGFAILGVLLCFIAINEGNGLGSVGVAGLGILVAIVFGIMGIYKLLTISKGRKVPKDRYSDKTITTFGSREEAIDSYRRHSITDGERFLLSDEIVNSNIEVRIWKNKKILVLILFFVFFIITLF